MVIRSDLQPQVNELPCRYRGDRIQDDAPEPEAIRKESGGLGSLQSPVGASDPPRD